MPPIQPERAPGEDVRVVESRIGPEADGLRLDHWLSARFDYRSRARWQDAIRDGEILVNSLRVRCSRRLKSGDSVSFRPQDTEEPPVCADFSILHENPNYIVVDKPGNLPCHPAGRFFKNTLWNMLRPKYGELHIVNRLDRETSGLTLAARDEASAAALSGILSRGLALKTYIAIVHGRFPDGESSAEGFLSSDESSPVRKKRRFSASPCPGAESASTSFRLIGTDGGFSAVEATPKTGRLHQIRATLLSLGFPMVGDKLYGLDDGLYLKFLDGSLDQADLGHLILPRQALHAARLEFDCPLSARRVAFASQVPPDIRPLYESCLGV